MTSTLRRGSLLRWTIANVMQSQVQARKEHSKDGEVPGDSDEVFQSIFSSGNLQLFIQNCTLREELAQCGTYYSFDAAFKQSAWI